MQGAALRGQMRGGKMKENQAVESSRIKVRHW